VLIYPAIDLLDGQCVRLTQGEYDQVTTYDADPVRVAKEFVRAGAQWIHVVDLDAARTGNPVNIGVIQRLATAVQVPLQVGGGVRSLDRARRLISSGVARVVVGSKLAEDRSLAANLFQEFGEQVAAGIDSKDGLVAIHGWRDGTGFASVELARQLQELGACRVIITDISRDGALQGVNSEFMRTHVVALNIPIIASGGVTDLKDFSELAGIGVEGVIVGKALYEGRFRLEDALAAVVAC
jgi:phosphoribosylformimino-5-aminoimidazole carboxamide ribotide isomerase